MEQFKTFRELMESKKLSKSQYKDKKEELIDLLWAYDNETFTNKSEIYKQYKMEIDTIMLGKIKVSRALELLGFDEPKHKNDKDVQKIKRFLEDNLNESAVGERGRTGEKDAEAYITDEKIAEFSKLVKKLGGKTVARLLLNKLNSNGDKLKDSGDETLDDIEGMDIKNVNESKNIEAKYVSVMNTLRDLVKTVDSENFDSTDLRKLTRKFEMDLLNTVKNFKS